MYKIDSQDYRISYSKNSTIYIQEEVASHWYEIDEGVVRTCRYLANGTRHVTGFFAKGQIFGVEMARYSATAEAVTRVSLIGRVRSGLEGFAPVGEPVAAAHPLSLALKNAEERIHLLVLKGAPARLAAFLLVMAVEDAHGRCCVRLPMSRADIGDYLAVDVATVSRILSRFLRHRLLAPEAEGYVICGRDELEAIASGEPSLGACVSGSGAASVGGNWVAQARRSA